MTDRRAELARRKVLRQRFLEALYWAVDGSVTAFVNGFDVGAGLGEGREETLAVMEYLEEKGLVRVDDHREGTLRLTAVGVDHVEAAG